VGGSPAERPGLTTEEDFAPVHIQLNPIGNFRARDKNPHLVLLYSDTLFLKGS
jgi:hypothetical protein